jgi:L,D-transpeptidase YcbB
MIKKTVTRVGILPAIAALCVTGSLVARAETPPASAPAGTTNPAARPATPAHVTDPSLAATPPVPAKNVTPTQAAAAAPVAAPASTAAAPVAAPATTVAAPTPPPAKPPVAPVTTAATTPATPAATTAPAVAPAASPAPATTAAPAASRAAVVPPPVVPATAAVPPPAVAAPALPAATATPATPAAPNATAALPDPASGTAAVAAPAPVVPPADSIVAGVRAKLPTLAQKANEEEAAALASYYGEITGTALWVSTSGLTAKGKAAVTEIGRAENWGLPAAAFDVPSTATGALSPEAAADTEIQVALAVLKYARFARGGRINPANISQLMDQQPTLVPPKTVLTDIAAAEKPDAYLTSLHPKHQQFEALRQMLIKLRGGEVKEEVAPPEDPALAVQIPMGRVLKPGGTDPQVALLRQRLKVPAADPMMENVYDEPLQAAVKEFQTSKGLSPDGIVGNGTRQVLNGGPKPTPVAQTNDSKIDRILINMERWRWVPADMGEFHVWDNVPEFLTRIVKSGSVIHTDEIIVGQPSWPTPMFSADMKTIVFRPSWGVPAGIKAKELAPLLRKSSGAGFFGIFGGGYSAQAVLDAYDLKAYAGGRQVDPNSVDWANVNINSYSFQQPPGPKNVLGDVKFMFPNSHDVYMHDTPERNLFGKSFRALSHGCMRVHEPRRLAEVLLAEDKGWSAAKVQSMFSSGGEVSLAKHIPVHVTYMTARVDENGKLQTYGDFYGLDGRTAAALTGKSIRFEQPAYADDVVASGDPEDGFSTQPQSQQQQPRRKKQQQSPANIADAISGLFSP